ncbi:MULTISPECIES: hypothetical protein [Actinosynnema]|uniref:hypothetical protein n=1 Tax=Actinosynnema TaxID=40566 RepID=UPI0020A253E6|nr:hypothetical protein [Actinosynnema pretiosum]
MTGAVAFVFGLCMLSFAAGCVLTAWMLRRAEDVEEEPAEADGYRPDDQADAARESGGRAEAQAPSFPPDDFATRPIHRNPVVGVVGRWGTGGDDPWSDGGVDAAGPGAASGPGKSGAADDDPWEDGGVDAAEVLRDGAADGGDPRERPATPPKPLMRLVDIADLLARERPELVAQPEPAEGGAGGATPAEDQPADEEDAFASEEPEARPTTRASGLRVVPLHLLTGPDASDDERGPAGTGKPAGRNGGGVEPEVAIGAGFADADELSLEASYLVSKLSELGWAEEVARVVEEGRGRGPREPVDLTTSDRTTPDRADPAPGGAKRPVAEGAAADRPVADRTEADRQVAGHPVADREVAGDPVAERPVSQRPAADRQVAERPVADRPAADHPVGGRSAAERPEDERSVAEHLAADRPAADQPTADQPVAERLAGGQPAAESPAAERLAAGPPVVDRPAADQPVIERLAGGQPVAESPAADRPAAGPPVADRPATGQPLVEAPVTDHLAADQPVAERAVAERSEAGSPVPDASSTDRPAPEASSADHSASDRPSANRSAPDHPAVAPAARDAAEGEPDGAQAEAAGAPVDGAGAGGRAVAADAAKASAPEALPHVPGPRSSGRPEVPAPRDEGAAGELVAEPEVESPGAGSRGSAPARSADGLVAEPEPDLVDVLDLPDDPVDADEPEEAPRAAGTIAGAAEADPVDELVEQRRSGDLADVEPELGVEVDSRAARSAGVRRPEPGDKPAPSPVSAAREGGREVPPQGGTVSDEPEEQVRRRT